MDQHGSPARGAGEGDGEEQRPGNERFNHIGALFKQMREFRHRVYSLQMGEKFLIDLGENTNIQTLMNCRMEVLFEEQQEEGRMYTQQEERNILTHRYNVLEHEGKIIDLECKMRNLERDQVENQEIAILRQQIVVRNQKIAELEDKSNGYQYLLDRAMQIVDKNVTEKKCGMYCQNALPQAIQQNQQLRTSLAESMMAVKEAEKNYKILIENLQREVFRCNLRLRNVERSKASLKLETQEAMKSAAHWNQQANRLGQMLYGVSTPPLMEFDTEPHNLLMDGPEVPSEAEIVDTPSVSDIIAALDLNDEDSNDDQH